TGVGERRRYRCARRGTREPRPAGAGRGAGLRRPPRALSHRGLRPGGREPALRGRRGARRARAGGARPRAACGARGGAGRARGARPPDGRGAARPRAGRLARGGGGGGAGGRRAAPGGGGRRREAPSWPTGSGARGTSRVGVCTERAQRASTGRAPSGVGHERLRPRRGGPRSRRHRARARRAIGRGRMDTIVIRGGAELEGEVVVSGSKNAALPLLFATLLTRERSVVRNVPALADVRTTIQV